MTSLFRCPVCGAPLDREERVCRCPNRHSYDIAREGYTYLLPPNQKHSAAPGDDRGMAAARRDFLSKGYYAPLLNTLCCQILSLSGDFPVIWDVGCGEGYYTAGIYQALTAAGRSPRMAGTDISKSILRYAARRERGIEWAVASSYHLPAADETADVLLDCFSPLALEEFRRVLKPGGYFLYVVPGPDHLWELKQVLYDRPYPNEEKETPYEGFSYRVHCAGGGRHHPPLPGGHPRPVPDDALLLEDPAGRARSGWPPWRLSTARISFRVHIFRKL